MTPDDKRLPLRPAPGSLLVRQVSRASEEWTPTLPPAGSPSGDLERAPPPIANAPVVPPPPGATTTADVRPRGSAVEPSATPAQPGARDARGAPGPAAPVSAAAGAVVPAGEAGADVAIPMLTEVVDLPRYAPSELPDRLADLDWTALENRIRENVLDRMLRRSELLVETRLSDALRASLERASAVLAGELQSALSELVREMVSRAVAEELTRVHEAIAERDSEQSPSARPPRGTG